MLTNVGFKEARSTETLLEVNAQPLHHKTVEIPMVRGTDILGGISHALPLLFQGTSANLHAAN